MKSEYVCTHCGKPAVCTWNRFSKKWGSCGFEHGRELIDYPRDNENFANKSGDGVTK